MTKTSNGTLGVSDTLNPVGAVEGARCAVRIWPTLPWYGSMLTLVVVMVGNHPCSGQEGTDSTKAAAAAKESLPKVSDKPANSQGDQKEGQSADKKQWKSLIPEKGLEGWEITDFGGEGKVNNTGSQLVLEKGDPLSGINYKKADFPKDNFEIELEAQRIEGSDFLCGLTFPVADEYCSLIAGGWGGGVVGLSSVDGYDASENATSLYQAFENGKWYKFRLRVDPEFVTAWINDKEVIKQEREGHEFSTRIEVYVSRPLGFCAFESKVGLRNFRWRTVKADDKQ